MSGDCSDNLFTSEQEAFVASVNQEDLRAVLLHHLRLSKLMSADRDSFEKKHNALANKLMNLRVRMTQEAALLTEEADKLKELGLETLPLENRAKRLLELADPCLSYN